MYKKDYSNFVRPSSQSEVKETYCKSYLTGDEAKRIYLDEVKEADVSTVNNSTKPSPPTHKRNRKRKNEEVKLSDKDLFLTAQHNDVDTLIQVLDSYPDKINVRDEYGWSLLMIACQANSVETVKELLKRDIDTSIRDKAGNSAQSLVIKNKNIVIADLLLSSKNKDKTADIEHDPIEQTKKKVKLKEDYVCEICGSKIFSDKEEHLSSTIHNINASKGKKIPTSYVIPQSNKGFQMMLRGGWDKDSGLGPDGSGKKYPIKTVPKKDRKGLGNDKSKKTAQEEKKQHKTNISNDYHRHRKLEINFRREFY